LHDRQRRYVRTAGSQPGRNRSRPRRSRRDSITSSPACPQIAHASSLDPRRVRFRWTSCTRPSSRRRRRKSATYAADLPGILMGMPDPVTTIKVPRSLRERIATRANEQRKTAAEVITELLDDADRRARFDAVRASYVQVDASYLEETEAWDTLADGGMHA